MSDSPCWPASVLVHRCDSGAGRSCPHFLHPPAQGLHEWHGSRSLRELDECAALILHWND
jgi:hypothetical protein